MTEDSRREQVTRILSDITEGKQSADELLPAVYSELRELARVAVARENAAEIEPTMLVHEAFLRLVGDHDPGWNGRGHFFGAAAQAMRRILVDQARRRNRARHGGDRARVTLSRVEPEAPRSDDELLAIEEAVKELERADPRKGRIVNLRFYAGLTNEETARILEVSLSTVEREWRFIRTWLKTELAEVRRKG